MQVFGMGCESTFAVENNTEVPILSDQWQIEVAKPEWLMVSGAAMHYHHSTFFRACTEAKAPKFSPWVDGIKASLELLWWLCKYDNVIRVQKYRNAWRRWFRPKGYPGAGTSDSSCCAIDDNVEQKWWQHTALAKATVWSCSRSAAVGLNSRMATWAEVSDSVPDLPTHAGPVEAAKRSIDPTCAECIFEV
jgi:hypothetical protein